VIAGLPRLRDAAYLAWRALRAEPGRSAVMAAGAAVALLLPLFTRLAAQRVEAGLLSRARATPVVIGAKGNEFDLTMASLYFRGQVSEPLRYGDRLRIEENPAGRLGTAAPLDVRFSSEGAPIVGTVPEYFEARSLGFASGRRPALLGEVAAGAAVAKERRLEVGDTVRSDLRNLYNLAGAYPVLLEVVGLLEPAGTPDDDALFADLATTWALDGRIHGHGEVTAADTAADSTAGETAAPGGGALTARPDAPEVDVSELEATNLEATNLEATNLEAANLEATAALFLFQRIDAGNRDLFHLHGDRDDAPVTSLLVFPSDERARDLVLGEYALDERLQAVQPVVVVRTVLGLVLRAARVLDGYFAVVATTTAALLALVVTLSLRLRRRELVLMRRIGASRGAAVLVIGLELAMILGAALVAAVLAAWAGVAWLDARWG
jgi:putative ABC transport system permease protein